jgi:hypothetical protein
MSEIMDINADKWSVWLIHGKLFLDRSFFRISDLDVKVILVQEL